MTDRLREAAQAVVDLWDSDGLEPGEGFYQEATGRMTTLADALKEPAPALDAEARRTLAMIVNETIHPEPDALERIQRLATDAIAAAYAEEVTRG